MRWKRVHDAIPSLKKKLSGYLNFHTLWFGVCEDKIKIEIIIPQQILTADSLNVKIQLLGIQSSDELNTLLVDAAVQMSDAV
jgi:hypothetical protein